MLKNIKPDWKKIGYVASFLPFAAVSALFIWVLFESNQIFFGEPLPAKMDISYRALSISTAIMFGVIAVAAIVLSIISLTKRKEKRFNLAALLIAIAVCAAGAVTFMVLCHLVGIFTIAFENMNLYLLYFGFALLANALVLFSSIRNLIKIKRAPVTFAKSAERPGESNG